MYPPHTTFVRSTNMPSGEVDGELVALDMEKGDCFGLDKIGTRIWKMADTPITLEDIIATLTAEYDVAAEQCADDLQPFLRDMIASGLLRIET